MIVETSIGKIHVGWKYTTRSKEIPVRSGKDIVEQDTTICTIIGKDKKEISCGISTRYFKDAPNKQIARRNAFIQAITPFSREDRKVIWNEFRKSVKTI